MRVVKQVGTLAHRFWNQLTTQGPVMTFWAGVDWSIRATTGSPIKRLSEITPNIYVGGQPSTSFWPTLVSDWEVTGVVNMRGEYNYAAKVDPLGLPLEFLHLPTVDNEAPALVHLEQGVDFIRDHIKERSGKVYVHCWEGLGRGPTMAAAYLVSTGLTPDEAWRKIRESRPFIRPTEVQREVLRQFAAHYKEDRAPKPVEVPEEVAAQVETQPS